MPNINVSVVSYANSVPFAYGLMNSEIINDINLSLDGNGKMSLKTSNDKTLASRITSNNKIQLKFTTSEFVGEFFHYTGDLFLIYKSGQLGRLNCSHT